MAGLTRAERAELTAAKNRIHDLEIELAVARRAVALLKDAGERDDPKAVLGGQGDGCRGLAVQVAVSVLEVSESGY